MPVLLPKLQRDEVIPSFQLPSTRGVSIGPRSYYRRRRNLVIFFFHDGQCQVCKGILDNLARHYSEFKENNAEVLGVSSVRQDEAMALTQTLKLPFPLLFDSTGEVVDRFTHREPRTGRPVPTIIITDRFGAVYTTIQVEESNPPRMEEILDWVKFIELQCPE